MNNVYLTESVVHKCISKSVYFKSEISGTACCKKNSKIYFVFSSGQTSLPEIFGQFQSLLMEKEFFEWRACFLKLLDSPLPQAENYPVFDII